MPVYYWSQRTKFTVLWSVNIHHLHSPATSLCKQMLTQIENQPVTWQQLNALRPPDAAKTTYWRGSQSLLDKMVCVFSLDFPCITFSSTAIWSNKAMRNTISQCTTHQTFKQMDYSSKKVVAAPTKFNLESAEVVYRRITWWRTLVVNMNINH